MRSIAAGCVVGIVVSAAVLMAQNPIREGRWEVTTQMQMANIPMQLPAQKTVHCITKKQLEDPGSTLPGGPDTKDKNNPCKVSDYKTSGNKVTWNLACSGSQPMTGSGEIIVNGDSYTGTMKMNSEKGEMTLKYTGKRLGDCTE